MRKVLKANDFYIIMGASHSVVFRAREEKYYWLPLDELYQTSLYKELEESDLIPLKNLDVPFSYSIITNAIINISNNINSLSNIFAELDLLFCENIELVIENIGDVLDLQIIEKAIEQSSIENISLHICNLALSKYIFEAFLKNNLRITNINVYKSDTFKSVFLTDKINTKITYTLDSFKDISCGVVASSIFNLHENHINESFHHNSCLNRKISIDSSGNIKNCPSMKESFGNIQDTTLTEAIEKPGFKKYWDINKDKILVCKDCEFRYICTDCRAYVEDPEDILSKPLKCGYNPYTGEWSEWSTNPLKQKAIDFYGMREMVDDNDRAPSV